MCNSTVMFSANANIGLRIMGHCTEVLYVVLVILME